MERMSRNIGSVLLIVAVLCLAAGYLTGCGSPSQNEDWLYQTVK